MDSEIDRVSNELAEEITSITPEELEKEFEGEDDVDLDLLFQEIKTKINAFLIELEEYEQLNTSIGTANTIGKILKKIELQKEFIYANFFEIQNLINAFLGQKIVMTYVHVDDEGRRSIRIAENDISHLGIVQGTAWNGSSFYKLGYYMEEHYRNLKNSLPEEDNEGLQSTAMEVERRYLQYKKRVMWYVGLWKGYSFSTKGPINETFVNFYVHNVQLLNSMEENIDTFMLDGTYGAINADATKGFLIGDVSRGGLQFAVKGIFGSPQGTKEVIKDFKKMRDDNFSKESFGNFLMKYYVQELQNDYKPQIRQMTKRSLTAMIKSHEELLQRIH